LRPVVFETGYSGCVLMPRGRIQCFLTNINSQEINYEY
jgi:hypothetical protein